MERGLSPECGGEGASPCARCSGSGAVPLPEGEAWAGPIRPRRWRRPGGGPGVV